MIFSVCSFQGTLLTDFSSVIRNLNLFRPLITGETSYQNSTSLLIGLALRDCCPSLPVFIFNFDGVSILVSFLLNLAATYSPTPSPPHRLQCSTIGRLGLNHRVRDGNGCCPQTHRHQNFLPFIRSRTVLTPSRIRSASPR